jgi:sigma-B regulation protein RsbU (phosphoserine phosphatase)
MERRSATMNDTNNKTNKTIGRSLMVGLTVLILVLSVAIGAIGFGTYSTKVLERYQIYLSDLLTFAASQIDADDMQACIDSGEKSETFEMEQKLLDAIKEHYRVDYIYIYKPLNTNDVDNMMNVMAGITSQERAEDEAYYSVELGSLTGEDNSAEVAGHFMEGMDSEDVTFFAQNTEEFGHMYTGMTALRDSSGKPVAMLAADVSIDSIYQTRIYYIIIISVAAIVLMIISLVSMNTWLKKRVVNPLQRLRDTAGSFVESSHHAESPDDLVITDPEIHTEDEMEALSNSITEMFEDMKHYMTDLVYVTKEKERIGAELNVATQIQADMLPNIFPAFPERDDLNIYASMTPAKEVGGDFYDFFFVDPDHLAIVMADVSGKGVPAALFMVIAKTLIKSVFQSGGGAGDSLADVNNRLCEGNEAGLFVTVWMAVIDLKTGEGVSLNAGHEHPALCKAGGDYELVVYKHSVAVAAMEDMIFRERRFKMDKGDKLFVYTDGVAEATNADNELFGTDRMIETLNKNKDKTLKEQVDGMKESIDEFVQDAPQFDDITMLCFEYKGQDN